MGVLATAGHVDLPLVGIAGHRFRVDGAEDRLRAEGPSCIGDELGVRHAAEFTDTLSAPAAIILRMSATLRKPPPTQ